MKMKTSGEALVDIDREVDEMSVGASEEVVDCLGSHE